jgi:regulator of cell morphogenesis and NO signaling
VTISSPPVSLSSRTVGDIAATIPGATGIFRQFKLDFCCGGDIALEDAARQGGVDIAELEHALNSLGESRSAIPVPQQTGDLIDYILSRYHETHRGELPELVKLSRRVEAVHSDHPQAPHGLAALLQQMLGELEVHMKKEELILFPAMRRKPAGGLDVPIAQMRHDHDDHGEHLRRLESLTGNFTLSEGACRSWQALYTGSAKLANDLMEHIHLENNILFPRYESRRRAEENSDRWEI